MNKYELLEYIMLGVCGLVTFTHAIFFTLAHQEINEGEKNVDKKCNDKSDGFWFGLLIGWWLF